MEAACLVSVSDRVFPVLQFYKKCGKKAGLNPHNPFNRVL